MSRDGTLIQQSSQKQAFTDLWGRYAPRVMAYARRHVDFSEAEEVVSETFVVAWRRREDIPADALPWLLATARNTIANNRRATRRRESLHQQMIRMEALAGSAVAAETTAVQRDDALRVLATLSAKEREALLLTAWDGLSASEAARVLGCSTATFYVRLLRARRRFASPASTRDSFPSPRDQERTSQ